MLNIHVALSGSLVSLGHFLCVQTLGQSFTREENLCVVVWTHAGDSHVLQGDTPLHREHIVMYIIIALFPDYYHYAYKILLATCIYKDGLELARHTQTDRSRGPKSQRKVHLYIYIYRYIFVYTYLFHISRTSPQKAVLRKVVFWPDSLAGSAFVPVCARDPQTDSRFKNVEMKSSEWAHVPEMISIK